MKPKLGTPRDDYFSCQKSRIPIHSQVFFWLLGKIIIVTLILLVITGLFSCEKQELQELESLDTPVHSRGAIDVTVESNMLKFGGISDVSDFLDEVEAERVSHESDSDSLQLRSQIDPGLYEVEQTLGYRSLRHLYDSLEYTDDDFRSTARGISGLIYISDSQLQTIFNEDCEVWVGDTIYKVIGNNRYYKIVDADLDVLNSIRADPDEYTLGEDDILTYFDNNSPPVVPRSLVCSALIEFLENPSSEYDPRVYVKVKSVNADGLVSQCADAAVSIDWGDGSNDYYHATENYIISHDYEVGAGEVETFTVEAIIWPHSSGECSDCDENEPLSTSTTYKVDNTAVCQRMNSEEFYQEFYSAVGRNWRVDFYARAQMTWSIFDSRKVWGESFLFRQKANGSWQRKKPDGSMYVRAFGTIYATNCNTTLDVFNDYTQKDRNCVDHKERPNQAFTWQAWEPQWPKFDVKVWHTSSPTPNMSETNLHL